MVKTVLLAGAAALAFGAAASADAAVYLQIKVDGNTIVNTTDGGTGSIFYTTPIAAAGGANFFVNVEWATGAPLLPAPRFDVMSNLQAAGNFTGNHTVEVLFSQTDVSSGWDLKNSVSFNDSAGVVATAQGFVDASNTAFGTATPLGALLAGGVGASSFNFNSPNPGGTYSQTYKLDYTFSGNQQTAQINYQIAAVPEAGTWMMMVAGFGLMGAAMRRRPRTQVTFA